MVSEGWERRMVEAVKTVDFLRAVKILCTIMDLEEMMAAYSPGECLRFHAEENPLPWGRGEWHSLVQEEKWKQCRTNIQGLESGEGQTHFWITVPTYLLDPRYVPFGKGLGWGKEQKGPSVDRSTMTLFSPLVCWSETFPTQGKETKQDRLKFNCCVPTDLS